MNRSQINAPTLQHLHGSRIPWASMWLQIPVFEGFWAVSQCLGDLLQRFTRLCKELGKGPSHPLRAQRDSVLTEKPPAVGPTGIRTPWLKVKGADEPIRSAIERLNEFRKLGKQSNQAGPHLFLWVLCGTMDDHPAISEVNIPKPDPEQLTSPCPRKPGEHPETVDLGAGRKKGFDPLQIPWDVLRISPLRATPWWNPVLPAAKGGLPQKAGVHTPGKEGATVAHPGTDGLRSESGIFHLAFQSGHVSSFHSPQPLVESQVMDQGWATCSASQERAGEPAKLLIRWSERPRLIPACSDESFDRLLHGWGLSWRKASIRIKLSLVPQCTQDPFFANHHRFGGFESLFAEPIVAARRGQAPALHSDPDVWPFLDPEKVRNLLVCFHWTFDGVEHSTGKPVANRKSGGVEEKVGDRLYPLRAPVHNSGRGDWIRTSDPLLPKQMRYQAAPLPGPGA